MIKFSKPIEEIKKISENMQVTYYPTRFSFMNIHRGIRPSCIHGIIGTMGGGKSTLLKSLICDVAEKEKCLVWLSEETIEEYQILINQIDNKHLDNIVFVEEKFADFSQIKTHTEFLDWAERQMLDANVNIIFIDNITTSRFYSEECKPSGQYETARRLTSFAKKTGVSIVYLAHTRKDVTDNYNKIIRSEDVRGNAQIAIQSEYLYTLQKFTVKDKIIVIIKLEKCRHHDRKEKSFFLLAFKDRFYMGDCALEFSELNFVFKNRDFLGNKNESDHGKFN